MSKREAGRIEWMSRVKKNEMNLREVSEKLGISHRQAKRVWKRYKKEGEEGLVHRLRGKPSNRRVDEAKRKRVVELYQTKYRGFGVTLAAEYMLEEDKEEVAVETLRYWLKQAGLYERQRKSRPHRSWRPRRERAGEMVQMDGSPHAWFGEEKPKAVLMEMVDDATGRTHSRFYEEETTEAAMDLFSRYVRKYGLPQSLYVDHDSIYEINRENTREEALRGEGPLTQFGRAMKELRVQIILANSPQAKGRVERRHGTMQDRLIKVMKLKGISNIEEGNRFLDDGFLAKENAKFVKRAKRNEDGHRKLPAGTELRVVLSIQEERTVQSDWTVVWRNRWFQLGKQEQKSRLVAKKIQVCRLLDGTMQLQYRGRELKWKELKEKPERRKRPVLEGKGKDAKVKRKNRRSKPGPNHPWRNFQLR